jgi:hypothetical protein
MLVFRYGEVQANGFWIAPLSVDTLVSTVTKSILFRSVDDTTAWFAFGIITLLTALAFAGHSVYKNLAGDKKPVFRLLLAMTSLPVVLLAIGSLPPLRSSYVYRYILVAAVASTLVIAVITLHVKFKKHNPLKRLALGTLVVVLFATGAAQAVYMGNRNLDTAQENKLAQTINNVQEADHPALIVLRSPYSYYVAKMYETSDYSIRLLYNDTLEKVGSTKPLFDHPEYSVTNFDGLDKVWLVGEDEKSVTTPTGSWVRKNYIVKFDDVTKKVAAAAAYYERVQ